MKKFSFEYLSSWLSAVAGFVVALFALVASFTPLSDQLRDFIVSEPKSNSANQDILVDELSKEIDILKNRLSDIDNTLKHTTPNNDIALAQRFNEIDSQLDKIQNSLGIVSVIEKAVVENPERAMSIPMLRKDFDAIKIDANDTSRILRAEIDRIYDLGKWFIGLMGTMAIGVLGLAVGNILKNKE